MMSLNGFKRLFEGLTGLRIYRALPHGICLFADLKNSLPNLAVTTVFDVGANDGQSARDFSTHFPTAQIYCFEPVASTYRQLWEDLRRHSNIRAFQLALGAQDGTGTMVRQGNSKLYHLLRDHGADGASAINLEQVVLQTIDRFCDTHELTHINLLKIDTEGHDLEVLKGSERLLSEHRIDVIQVEAGMNWQNQRHAAFADFMTFLEPKGYYLFGVYEQVNEWSVGAPNLRRTNPVVISDRVIKANTASHVLSLLADPTTGGASDMTAARADAVFTRGPATHRVSPEIFWRTRLLHQLLANGTYPRLKYAGVT